MRARPARRTGSPAARWPRLVAHVRGWCCRTATGSASGWTGPPLRPAPGAGELPSEPTLPGAIQVPPDGQPIVLGPDAPVTGGYPVIAVVREADLDRLAQLRPGDRVALRELGQC